MFHKPILNQYILKVHIYIYIITFINFTSTHFFIVFHRNLGFLLDKKIGVNQPKRIENAKILIANTSMDADKIKVGYLHTIRSCFKYV